MPDFGDQLRHSLQEKPFILPEHERWIGPVHTTWHEIEPKTARITTEGGTWGERRLAEWITQQELEAAGYKQSKLDMDKTATWADIAQKAKRLIQSGNVSLLRNGSQHVVAHVVGDHGEYNSEFGRDDPDSNAITTWTCLLPDAPITMADGTRRPISQVQSGDKVLTHLGHIRTVKVAWSRPYTGMISKVKLQGMDEWVIATQNHPFWVANEDIHLERLVGWRGRRKRGTKVLAQGPSRIVYESIPARPKVDWKMLGEVEPNDYLSMAAMQDERRLLVTYEGNLRHKSSHQKITIDVDEEMAFILGWYAAEGAMIKKDGTYTNRISFTLHKDEMDIARQIVDVCYRRFGVQGSIRPLKGRNTLDVRISHYGLQQMCDELVGHNSRDGQSSKRLSQKMLHLPRHIQEVFIDAWSNGDGCIDKGRRSIGTVNIDLANQIRLILCRLGYPASLSWTDKNTGGSIIPFPENCRRFYKVRWTYDTTKIVPGRFIERDGQCWYRVEETCQEYYNGPVFDLEIEGDHSFQAYSVNCHNCECPWDQYAWGRTRQWKQYEGRPCHLPGSIITLADGSYRPIEDIRSGDEVITHSGTSVVTQDMVKPYRGKIYKIYRAGFPYPISITENHEIWARKTPNRIRNASYNRSIRKNQGFRIYDDSFVGEVPEWIDAQSLRVNDWIASTYVEEEADGPGDAWATILGYYLAEGNLAKYGSNYKEVQWTFHKDETALHQELYTALEAIGLRHRTYRQKNRNSLSIRVTSPSLAEWLLEMGGHLASYKTLNGAVLRWPTEQLELLVAAWANGDGDLKKDGRQAINTSSVYLARQLYDILVKCGYVPSWTIQPNNGGPQNRSKVGSINRIMFKWAKRGKGNGRRRYQSRYLSKIVKIEEEWYEGPVYNLSVLGHESYVAEGVTNHNCAHVLAAYWKSLSTPLDDVPPGGAVPPGQAQPQAPMPTAPLPGAGMGPQGEGLEQATKGEPLANEVGMGMPPPQPGMGGPMGGLGGGMMPGISPGMMPTMTPGMFPGVGDQSIMMQNMMHNPPMMGQMGAMPGMMGLGMMGMGMPPSMAAPLMSGVIPPFPMAGVQQGAVSIPGGKINQPANPVQWHGGTLSSVKKAEDETFNNGDVVRLEDELYGVAGGPVAGQYGDGQYRMVPKNAIGETLGVDPDTGWVDTIFPLDDSGPNEPYHVRAWVEPEKLTLMNRSTPFVQKRSAYDVQLTPTEFAGGESADAHYAVDPQGNQWLVKENYDPNKTASELLANSVYRTMGMSVPNMQLYGDGKIAYPLMPGEQKPFSGVDPEKQRALGQNFMTDALIGNWDWIGRRDDNVLWNGNEPTRIDHGGTFEYRGMLGNKPYGPIPEEVDSMRNRGQGKHGVIVDEPSMRSQAAVIGQTLSPDVVDQLIDQAPFQDEEMRERLRQNLKARVDWMRQYANGEQRLSKNTGLNPLGNKVVVNEGQLSSDPSAMFEGQEHPVGTTLYYMGQPQQVTGYAPSGEPTKGNYFVKTPSGEQNSIEDQYLLTDPNQKYPDQKYGPGDRAYQWGSNDPLEFKEYNPHSGYYTFKSPNSEDEVQGRDNFFTQVPYTTPLTCKNCQGSGQVAEICPTCGGTGHIEGQGDPQQDLFSPGQVSTCPQCHGSGEIQVRCPKCQGTGNQWQQAQEAMPAPPDDGEIYCPKCDGWGKMEDGSRCSKCGGTGRIVKFWEDHPDITPDEGHYPWMQNLNYGEKRVLVRYTGGSNILNNVPRGTSQDDYNEESPESWQHLDEALDAHPLLQAPTTLFRGTFSNTLLNEFGPPSTWKPGTIQTDHGYLSTSVKKQTGLDNAIAGQKDKSVLFIFHAPAGFSGAYMADVGGHDYGSEQEWLLPRGTSWEITRVGQPVENSQGGWYTPVWANLIDVDPTVGNENIQKAYQ